MYLGDTELNKLLPQLEIVTDSSTQQFDAAAQVQPCSVDLTLSPMFWKERRKGTVDLRRSTHDALQPRHNWKRFIVDEQSFVTLRPGQLLLGRTSEKFTMPSGYAGKLSGRSSFARIGLCVHCTGDFINPCWRGHMPLELVNVSKSDIRLVPGLPICQIQIIKIHGEHESRYGDNKLQSKYIDDDGGPSYWWRDERIERLQKRLGQVDLSERVRNSVAALIGSQEPDVVARFERDLDKMKLAQVQEADAVIELFGKREDRRRKFHRTMKAVLVGQFAACCLGFLSGVAFSQDWGLMEWLILGLVGPSAILALWAHNRELGDFFERRELSQQSELQLSQAEAEEPVGRGGWVGH